ncbi:MAG: hypothetical protein KJP21_08130 [Bacteroidia bacterium]|nr:hypothetical protein [Bacteroidia bacterium]NNJ54525.1 hypothetical protein [Bacteroidia bacterium]
MKISIVAIVLLSILASFFLPWWVIAPICFVVTYLAKLKPIQAFLISFISIFIVWICAIYYFDYGSVQPLVGELLGIPSKLTSIVAAVIGGLMAGVFGLSGSLLGKKPKRFVNG